MSKQKVNFISTISKKALWELFSEYSESSSLHGVKYVGEKKRHWVERYVLHAYGFINRTNFI